MRTSKLGLILAGLVLAGCDAGLSTFGVGRTAPDQISLPDGTVIAGAAGWCVDPRSSRSRGDTSVVVLGSCAALSGNVLEARPFVSGVVTVSVEQTSGLMPTPEELEGFFASETGRAVLAQDGRAESIEALQTAQDDGLLFLHAEDASSPKGVSPDIYRAVFDLDGRFVSVSLYGPIERPIARSDGLTTLKAQVDELRQVNAR